MQCTRVGSPIEKFVCDALEECSEESKQDRLEAWMKASSIFRTWIHPNNVKQIEMSYDTLVANVTGDDLLLFSNVASFYRRVCEYCAVLLWAYDEVSQILYIVGEILPEYYSSGDSLYLEGASPRIRDRKKPCRGVMARDVQYITEWLEKNNKSQLNFTGCLPVDYTYRTSAQSNGEDHWMWLPNLSTASRFRGVDDAVTITLGESKISWRIGLIEMLVSLEHEETSVYRCDTTLCDAVETYLRETPEAPADLASPDGRIHDQQSFMICMLLAAENSQFYKKMVLAETLLLRYKLARFPREDEIHEMLFRNAMDKRLLDFLLDEDGARESNIGAQEKRLLMVPFYGDGFFQKRQLPTRVYMIPIDEYPIPYLRTLTEGRLTDLFPPTGLAYYATANHVSPIIRGLVAITYVQIEEWLMYSTHSLMDGVRVHLHRDRAIRAYARFRSEVALSDTTRRVRNRNQQQQHTRAARNAIKEEPFYASASDEMCGAMDDKEMGVLRTQARIVGFKNGGHGVWNARSAASELLEEQHVSGECYEDGDEGPSDSTSPPAIIDLPPCIRYVQSYSESTVGDHPDFQARKFLLTFLAEAGWEEKDVLPFYKSLFDQCRCSKHADISTMSVDEFSSRTEYGTYIKTVFRDHGRSIKRKKVRSGEERDFGMHFNCNSVMEMGFCPFYGSTKHGLPRGVNAPTYTRDTLLKNSGASVTDIEDLCKEVARVSVNKDKVKCTCTKVLRHRHPEMQIKYDIYSPNAYYKVALFGAVNERQSEALKNKIEW